MRASAGCVRLYPEDIALIYEAVPDGTKVTVVNQPFVLGWRGDELLVQAYQPLEDDKRNWTDVPKALRKKLEEAEGNALEARGRARGSDRLGGVGAAAAKPRGIAIAVGPGTGAISRRLVAAAPRVRNALPVGANWNGVEDQYASDPRFAKPARSGKRRQAAGN